LTRWLRFLGFQTWYFRRIQDVTELLQTDPSIIYITRSTPHIKQINPANYFLITEDLIERQLHKLDEQFSIFQDINLLSLCSRCNVGVEIVAKKEVLDKVPTKVSINFDQFWKCPECQQIYWNGSHVMRLREKLERMKIPLP
jgi:uncharacterized protein with PIN domain